MRRSLAALLLAVVATLGSGAGAQDALPKLGYLGQMVLPTGLKVGGIEFGGISGIDYDRTTGALYAISDDRSEKAPARFYRLRIVVDDKGIASLDIAATVLLLTQDGKLFEPRSVDPESIHLNPATGTLLWSSEGDAAGVPSIQESSQGGSLVRSFALPAYDLPNADKTAGVYNNLGHEGLTLSLDGRELVAITENGLAQDGPRTSLEAGSRARLTHFDLATGQPSREYVYVTEPIPVKATQAPFANDNGVSELLAYDEGRYIVVERAFALGVGNTIRLYLASEAGATDVLGKARLDDAGPIQPMRKDLLLTLGEGDFGLDIDNIEGITFGPEINGARTLLLASDNNFNRNGQFTQLVLLRLE